MAQPQADTLAEQVTDLRNLLAEKDMVAGKDRGFAESLVKNFDKRGSLSEKQAYWVGVLIQRAIEGEPEPATVELNGTFANMIALFTKAKEHLKFPKIRLATDSGDPVVLGVAGPNAKQPGTINITDGGPFGANEWYGRILTDGNWQKPKNANGYVFEEVGNLLEKFASNPARVAAEYGKLTGNCCFCNKSLTDEKSTDVGYGPVCAKNFGLPWGKKK